MEFTSTVVVSANNLWNSLDPDQARQKVRPDRDPNCLTLCEYSWKNFAKKVGFKKINRPQKAENYPVGNELIFRLLKLW